MSNEVLVALIGSLTTTIVAAGGWWFAWKVHRDSRARDGQRETIQRLLSELLARAVFEREANDWIASLDDRTSRSAMLEIRKRVKDEIGYGPKFSEQQIKDMIQHYKD